jgi:TonB-dependent SusC/RagA subfamily outer membrane receptor
MSRRYQGRVGSRLQAGAVLFVFATLAACQHGQPAGPAGTAAPYAPGSVSALERTYAEDATMTVEDLVRRSGPGVDVKREGSRTFVVIRGIGTISNEGTLRQLERASALIVLDGVRQPSADILRQLSPLDVERIVVLKDAAAAEYGAYASNGVVVITTRRAR